MPNYTLAQLRAMQAERRYWDTRDPENADFVAQVDQGYRDLFDEPAALVPTPEQEEQSRRLEEDLRRRMAQSEYWNPRHADYRRLHDDVAQGYAKLYPAADSSAAAPAPAMPTAPVNLLELAQQMVQAQPLSNKVPDINPPISEKGGRQPTEHPQLAVSPFWLRPESESLGGNLPLPPRVIHPDVDAPWDPEGNWAAFPTEVSPRAIEKLWGILDNPDKAFDDYLKEQRDNNRTNPDRWTGKARPATEEELRQEFNKSPEDMKKFLWDYYERRDGVYPDKRDHVDPEHREIPPNEYNPNDRLGVG
jgi:hypothetical protein